MSLTRWSAVLGAVLLTSCTASPVCVPLSPCHPANPCAPETPVRARPRTLAISPDDRPGTAALPRAKEQDGLSRSVPRGVASQRGLQGGAS